LVERRRGGERGARDRQDDGQRNGGQGGSPGRDICPVRGVYMDAGHALTVQHSPWIRRLLPREPAATVSAAGVLPCFVALVSAPWFSLPWPVCCACRRTSRRRSGAARSSCWCSRSRRRSPPTSARPGRSV